MQSISTAAAPEALGPYSQAVLCGAQLYLSGQIAIDPATGQLVQGSVEAETERVLLNLQAVLREAQCGFGNVVKTTVFVTDIGYFDAVNGVYARYFAGHAPARSFVQVAALPKGARVEIEAVAVKQAAAQGANFQENY